LPYGGEIIARALPHVATIGGGALALRRFFITMALRSGCVAYGRRARALNRYPRSAMGGTGIGITPKRSAGPSGPEHETRSDRPDRLRSNRCSSGRTRWR